MPLLAYRSTNSRPSGIFRRRDLDIDLTSKIVPGGSQPHGRAGLKTGWTGRLLFVGHDVAGRNLAIMQTFVATCVASNVNPQDYLADVLIKIQTQPQSKIDDLLPHNWQPPPTPGGSDQEAEKQRE